MSAYRGPVGVGSLFRRGDKVIQIVGGFSYATGWPYELIQVGETEVPLGARIRRHIEDDKLRQRFEPVTTSDQTQPEGVSV